MFAKLTFVTICTLLTVCNSAYVNTFKKCSMEDDNCFVDFFKHLLHDISNDGIDKLNIPPIDPLHLKDLYIPIPGFFNIKVEEGEVTGVKDCAIDRYHNDFDKGVTNAEVTCDLIIKAKFHFDDASEFVRNLFGQESDSGNGELQIMIEKIKIKLDIAFDVIKKDGDIVLKLNLDKFHSEYDIGDFQIKVNKMMLGSHDIAETVENFFNQNWKTLLPTLVKYLFEVAMKICMEFIGNYFERVPAEQYLTSDISKYIKN